MEKQTLFLFLFFFGLLGYSQNSTQLIGTWKLEKISYKNLSASNDGEQEQLLNVLKAGLYKQLNAEQRLDIYELEQLNEKAAELLKLFYQSAIEFQSNRAFYNRSKLLERPTSGEYLLDRKKLFMEWETADKYTYKILKLAASELVLKDVDLKITYYYIKLYQKTVDVLAAKLKNERLKCTIPDPDKASTQKEAEEDFRNKTKSD